MGEMNEHIESEQKESKKPIAVIRNAFAKHAKTNANIEEVRNLKLIHIHHLLFSRVSVSQYRRIFW